MAEQCERRLRALIIAESCNPEWASVPLVGWSHSQALTARTDGHLVTHARQRPALLRAGLREGEDFTALEVPAVERSLATLSRLLGVPYGSNKAWTMHTAFSAVDYPWFERRVWQRFGERLRRHEFDVVHRLTPLSPAIPSPLARLCRRAGVPFVLGPLNGGLPWPTGFLNVRVAEREWLGFARGAARLVPGYSSTRACSAAILVGSRHAWAEISKRFRRKTVYVPENGIDQARFPEAVAAPPGLPLRVAFAGRLVPIKAVDMLVEAAAPLARDGRLSLTIAGEGPQRPALEALVAREGIASCVHFAGWVEHARVREVLAGCHLFGFPSIRDFGGAAVLEAMALGLVPLVVDYGGPGELVSPSTGFAVPMGSRRQIVRRLAEVLRALVADPRPLLDMSCRARERALRSFTWDTKAEQVLEVYDFALGRRPRPDFGMPFPDPPLDAASLACATPHPLPAD